jgi:hypothetical protein
MKKLLLIAFMVVGILAGTGISAKVRAFGPLDSACSGVVHPINNVGA